ncbi:lipopolysaccharide biosynthesis protein [Tabrizicola sp. BL-A-41-H6]|uniref:lipopolysaccharide biosynthesis protein n=1 Tax=Tabrizicola sp. BL-A-41-H6 TaxID=3421107 RepID=UPI003D67CEB4
MSLGGRLRFLAKDSAVYGMAAAISRFASLITFPIIVRYLSVAEYGVFDILQFFGGFLTVFLVFGQDSGVARYFFEYEDHETRRELISQSFFLRLYVLALALPLAWLLGGRALSLLGIDQEFLPAFNMLLLQAPFLVLLNFVVVLLRVTFSRNKYIFLSVGFSFTQAICWLTAIFLFDASVRGILFAGLLASAVFSGIGIYYIRAWLKPTPRLNYILQMLSYTLPYGAISALRRIVPLIERSLVALLLTTDALGLYAAGAKITMLFGLFAFAFQSAWEPFALSIGKRPDAQSTYNLVLKILVLLSCLLVLALSSIARPMIVFLASEKYVEAAVIVFPLLMALAVESISWITEIGLILQRRTGLKLVAYILGTLAFVVAMFVLTPAFELVGVSIAVLFGSVVRTVVLTLMASRVSNLKWDTTSFIIIVPLTVLSGAIMIYADNEYGLAASLGTFAAATVILLTLAYTVVLSSDERQKLKAATQRLLASRGF